MKFLEALCVYMENIAAGIRIWLGFMAGVLALIAIISLIFVKDITQEQLSALTTWTLIFTLAGLAFPPEKVWFHWRIMLERRNERD